MENRSREMVFTDLKDMLKQTGEVYAGNIAYRIKNNDGTKKEITHGQFRDEINQLGTELISMGLKGKRIAVISENRYEWEQAYLAIATGTGVVVPLDKSLPENELESLILRSEVEAIFYSKKYDEIMKKMHDKGYSKLKYFISMDIDEKIDYVYSQKQLVREGKKKLESGDQNFINAKINNEEMGIMLFTSGTTSMSKAVMLTQKNIISNVMDIIRTFELNETDSLLSFLPLHHVFECTVGFLYPISIGASIAFCDGVKYMADNLKEYSITAMISVPAVYEVIYKKILKSIEKQGKLDKVKKGIKISEKLLKIGIDIRKKIFHEIHESLGGKIRLLVAGGAALDKEVEKGFGDLGFNLVQGYGLTESSPVIASELTKARKLGSIGKKFPSMEVKLLNEDENGIGELLAKGPTIMLGYYKNEEATKQAIDEDGWLHTGDLAHIDKDGYIFISGRKKDVIVLQNGKNVFPEEIEALVNKVEGVNESFIYGKPGNNGDLKIAVKIVYNKELMKHLYEMTDEEKIQKFFAEEVKKINQNMPRYKSIKEVSVSEEPLIKTTTLKIKRHEELKKILDEKR